MTNPSPSMLSTQLLQFAVAFKALDLQPLSTPDMLGWQWGVAVFDELSQLPQFYSVHILCLRTLVFRFAFQSWPQRMKSGMIFSLKETDTLWRGCQYRRPEDAPCHAFYLVNMCEHATSVLFYEWMLKVVLRLSIDDMICTSICTACKYSRLACRHILLAWREPPHTHTLEVEAVVFFFPVLCPRRATCGIVFRSLRWLSGQQWTLAWYIYRL